jgi:hypothetical protein
MEAARLLARHVRGFAAQQWRADRINDEFTPSRTAVRTSSALSGGVDLSDPTLDYESVLDATSGGCARLNR